MWNQPQFVNILLVNFLIAILEYFPSSKLCAIQYFETDVCACKLIQFKYVCYALECTSLLHMLLLSILMSKYVSRLWKIDHIVKFV